MGYYSTVALALSTNAVALLSERLKTSTAAIDWETAQTLFDHADEHKVDEATGEHLYQWYFTKWYHVRPGVALVENLMSDLPDEDYLFIRDGESSDDLEILGQRWVNAFGLNVSTTIVTA